MVLNWLRTSSTMASAACGARSGAEWPGSGERGGAARWRHAGCTLRCCSLLAPGVLGGRRFATAGVRLPADELDMRIPATHLLGGTVRTGSFSKPHLAHRLHGHSREPVGQHGAHQQARKHLRGGRSRCSSGGERAALQGCAIADERAASRQRRLHTTRTAAGRLTVNGHEKAAPRHTGRREGSSLSWHSASRKKNLMYSTALKSSTHLGVQDGRVLERDASAGHIGAKQRQGHQGGCGQAVQRQGEACQQHKPAGWQAAAGKHTMGATA